MQPLKAMEQLAELHFEQDEIDDLLPEFDPDALLPVAPLHSSLSKRVKKDPETIRQRRNFLQRKRMHAKEDSTKTMRKTVKELEQRYEALCAMADARRATSSSRGATYQQQIQDQHSDRNMVSIDQLVQQASTSANTCTPAKAHSLHALVKEMHSLIHENSHLRNLVERHVYYQYTLRTIVEEAELERSITSALEIAQCGKFCYMPFTPEDCYVIIREDLALNVFKKPDFDDPVKNKQLAFGWRGSVSYENASTIRFQCVKEWPGIPETNCEVMWKYFCVETDNKHVYGDEHCMEILQHVSDDIKIARRRMPFHGWTSWTVYMMYRVCMGDSFLYGGVPLPLWGKGNPVFNGDKYGKAFLNEKETMVVRPVHHLLEPVVKENGVVRTQVYRWGSLSCDQTLFMPIFEQCALETMVRFEQLVLCPLVENVIKLQ